MPSEPRATDRMQLHRKPACATQDCCPFSAITTEVYSSDRLLERQNYRVQLETFESSPLVRVIGELFKGRRSAPPLTGHPPEAEA
jgi:hypothetical protein